MTAAAAIRKIIRLPAWAMIVTVKLYQQSLSHIIGRQCRFMPTCSQYFIEAVEKHGAIRGGLMGAWRILRCNPFCKGGYDPVK